MNKILFTCCLSTIITATSTLAETVKKYEVPPSSRANYPTSVPSISDEAAKKCVELYNEAQWLREDIESTKVDRYNQAAIDAYNANITSYRDMIDNFNSDCAGKQSQSAKKAAQELNESRESSP